MDKGKNLIAVASSDGIVVNSHFGRAKNFYIYEESDEQVRYIEKREVEPVCDGGNHDDKKIRRTIEKLLDCNYLLVSRIGNGAAALIENQGIDVYEIPGMIEESIQQLLKYEKVKKLFL